MKASEKASWVLERHFILVTLSLVTIIGLPAAFSLFSIPRKIDRNIAGNAHRNPASVSLVQDSAAISSLGTSISKDVGCENAQDLGSTSSAHLRLKTGPCGESTNVQILNQTNGFTAEIMELKTGHATSDFIDLSEGENLIQISRLSTNGVKVEQIIKVHRTPASKNE